VEVEIEVITATGSDPPPSDQFSLHLLTQSCAMRHHNTPD
jgi:hypothetical protein